MPKIVEKTFVCYTCKSDVKVDIDDYSIEMNELKKLKQEHAEMVEMLEDVCSELYKCDNLMASDVRQLLNKIKENGN